MNVDIEASWKQVLAPEFAAPYFQKLTRTITDACHTSTVYPQHSNLFAAFNLCPLSQVKVVILGQDPYHGPNQAHGLAFSVPEQVAIPPSLQNIYKEIEADIGKPPVHSGNLERWATQGVLLLNTTLTVLAHEPGSHRGLGWERFTDAVISIISKQRSHVVFLLWGRPAQSKDRLIDVNTHLVLKASHPSPLSAYRGFFGCKHFSQANTYLKRTGQQPINW